MKERYFYHCFPRRRGANKAESFSKGLKVLKSILKSGLVLTPERTEWFEFLADGNRSKPIEVFQKRICFTELSPSELPQHTEIFGDLALEFSIEQLRYLGAIPVFYLPSMAEKEAGLAGLGGAFIARLAEVQELLTRLEKMDQLVKSTSNKTETLNVTRNGVVVAQTRSTVGGAEDLLAMLQTEIQPVSALLGSLRAVSGFFYPTENLKFNSLLDYYRQREWRIVGNSVWKGKPVCEGLTKEDEEGLLEIDTEFFKKEMAFPSGKFPIVHQCQKFSVLEGKHIIQYARRVFAPKKLVSSVEALLSEHRISVPVERTPQSGIFRRIANWVGV